MPQKKIFIARFLEALIVISYRIPSGLMPEHHIFIHRVARCQVVATAEIPDRLVGVHNDAVVNRHRGRNFPLLNLNERVLSVLACKHVDDVLIDPPWHMTREMVAALRIAVVAHGTTHDANDDGGRDPYEVPKALGVYVELPSRFPLTVDTIVERINANHERLAAKVQKKIVRRHSSGDHAFLPDRTQREAIKAAQEKLRAEKSELFEKYRFGHPHAPAPRPMRSGAHDEEGSPRACAARGRAIRPFRQSFSGCALCWYRS